MGPDSLIQLEPTELVLEFVSPVALVFKKDDAVLLTIRLQAVTGARSNRMRTSLAQVFTDDFRCYRICAYICLFCSSSCLSQVRQRRTLPQTGVSAARMQCSNLQWKSLVRYSEHS